MRIEEKPSSKEEQEQLKVELLCIHGLYLDRYILCLTTHSRVHITGGRQKCLCPGCQDVSPAFFNCPLRPLGSLSLLSLYPVFRTGYRFSVVGIPTMQ